MNGDVHREQAESLVRSTREQLPFMGEAAVSAGVSAGVFQVVTKGFQVLRRSRLLVVVDVAGLTTQSQHPAPSPTDPPVGCEL